MVALNYPSVQKYEPVIASGGLLLYNASLTPQPPARADIRCVPIPASDIAAELGNLRLLNMVMPGALLQITGVLPIETVEKSLEAHLPAHRRDMLEANKLALRRGAELAQSSLVMAQA